MARRGFERRNPEPSLSGLDPAQHVQRIVEAAEQAAVQIREEAEAEAQRYLEEYRRRVDRLVSERMQLTETLAEQTGRIKDQYDRFLAALDGALRKVNEIAGNGESPLPPPEFPPRSGTASDAPSVGPDPLAPPERRTGDPADETPATEPEREERSGSRWSRWQPKADRRSEPDLTATGSETTPGGYRPRPAAKGERLLAMQMLAAGESRDEIERRLSEEFDVPDPGGLIDELLGG
jgi:CRISPR/Cas system CSM-associated protein Csm2 small subunit